MSAEASSSSRRGSVASRGSDADELDEAPDLLASTLKDGLDALELVVTDLLAAKEMRELTSDLRHLPEECEQLVEAAARLASES